MSASVITESKMSLCDQGSDNILDMNINIYKAHRNKWKSLIEIGGNYTGAHATPGSTWPPQGQEDQYLPHTWNLFSAYWLRSSDLEVRFKYQKNNLEEMMSYGQRKEWEQHTEGTEFCYAS